MSRAINTVPTPGLRVQVTSNSKGQSQIDLSNKQLGNIPVDIFNFTHIQVLKLSHNEIHHLSSAISCLRSLKVLHLDHNHIDSIPDTIANCKHLTELNLSSNDLQVLPSSLCGMKKLRVLNVGNNQLEQLPHDIGHLSDLRHLVVHNNKLWYLPFSVTNLHKIWSLHIAGNLFDHIPMPVCQMTSLHTLNASQNRLTAFPPDFENLKNLKELNVADNKFTAVGSLVFLHQLKYLNMNNNRLQLLPVEMSRLKHLKVLHAQGNRLQSVPDVLFNIQFLNIAHNELTSITVSRLLKMENFNIGDNKLETMPHGLGLLRNLKFLRLNDNLLHDVSPEILKLHKLETLDLSNNKLTSLPLELYQMTEIKSFNIHGNNITPPAPGVLHPIHRNHGKNMDTPRDNGKSSPLNSKSEIQLYKSNRLENMKGTNTLRATKNQHSDSKSIISFRSGKEDDEMNNTLNKHNKKFNFLEKFKKSWSGEPLFSKSTRSQKSLPEYRSTTKSRQPQTAASWDVADNVRSKALTVRAPQMAWDIEEDARRLHHPKSKGEVHQSTDMGNEIIQTSRGLASPKNPRESWESSRSTKVRSKKKSKNRQSWNLNGTIDSHASLETLPGLDQTHPMHLDELDRISRYKSEGHLENLPLESMNVLSTAEFQIDEVQANFSSEDEHYEEHHSVRSIHSITSMPSLQANTSRSMRTEKQAVNRINMQPTNQNQHSHAITNQIKAQIHSSNYHPARHHQESIYATSNRIRTPFSTNQGKVRNEQTNQKISSRDSGQTTDFNLLGVCTELETMMNKKLLHPALVLNTGLSRRFNEKVLKKTDDGLWRISNDLHLEENQCGIEYSPVETFTITENGGHYVSNYDHNLHVLAPARSLDRTVHATIQVLKINQKVLSQVQELNRFAENVIEIGPIVMLQLLEDVNFNSQVKVTIPAPKTRHGHLMLLTIQGDNSCIPSSSGYQFSNGSVIFNTWYFTRRVAIVTKAKCKYKACKSMEQILQCLGLINDV